MRGGLEELVIEEGMGEEAAPGDRVLGQGFLSQMQKDQPEWTVGDVEDPIFDGIVRRTRGKQEKNRKTRSEQEKNHRQMLRAITESMLSSTTTKQRISPQ